MVLLERHGLRIWIPGQYARHRPAHRRDRLAGIGDDADHPYWWHRPFGRFAIGTLRTPLRETLARWWRPVTSRRCSHSRDWSFGWRAECHIDCLGAIASTDCHTGDLFPFSRPRRSDHARGRYFHQLSAPFPLFGTATLPLPSR